MSISRAAVLVCLSLTMTHNARAAENWPDAVDDYVSGVRATIQTTNMDGYLNVVRDPQGAFLIDVREEDEYRAGHAPGTVNIPRGLLEFRIWRALGYPGVVDMARKIYVQCQTGGRATLAAKQLREVGFSNVTAVVMAFPDWKAKGNPIETSPAK